MNIKVLELTDEAFAPYGTFVLPEKCDNNPNECDKDPNEFVSFYPEKIVALSEFSNMPALSVLAMSKRELAIDITEIHEHTEEIFGGFNTDIVFHVAVPSGKKPNPEEFKVFRLPKHGYVRLRRKVWHQAPYSITDERAIGIVILPPYTYTNDCFVVKLREKITIDL